MSDEKKDKELVAHLSNTMTALWNAGVTMDEVATTCTVKKGEALYDRIGKCEAKIKEWESELNGLKDDLATLKKLIDGYPTKYGNEPSGLAQTSYDIASRQHDSIRTALAKHRKDLDKHKATLRKVKG
jgi:predicted DNA-binding protein YlxM (UPF0122 family)